MVARVWSLERQDMLLVMIGLSRGRSDFDWCSNILEDLTEESRKDLERMLDDFREKYRARVAVSDSCDFCGSLRD